MTNKTQTTTEILKGYTPIYLRKKSKEATNKLVEESGCQNKKVFNKNYKETMNQKLYFALNGALGKSNAVDYYLYLNGGQETLEYLEDLSRWISGGEANNLKEKINNIDAYFLNILPCRKNSKEKDKVYVPKAVNEPFILNRRANNLFRNYSEQLNGKAGTYDEFSLFTKTIENVLESGSPLNIYPNGEVKINLYSALTEKYQKVIENKNIHDSFKKEAYTEYSGLFQKMFGVTLEEAIREREK